MKIKVLVGGRGTWTLGGGRMMIPREIPSLRNTAKDHQRQLYKSHIKGMISARISNVIKKSMQRSSKLLLQAYISLAKENLVDKFHALSVL